MHTTSEERSLLAVYNVRAVTPLPSPSFRRAVTFVPLPLMAHGRTAKIGVDPIATERQLWQISATGQWIFYVGYVVFMVDLRNSYGTYVNRNVSCGQYVYGT